MIRERGRNHHVVIRFSQMVAKTGITSFHDAYTSPDELLAYQEARDASELRTRVYCLMGYWAIDKMIAAGVVSTVASTRYPEAGV